jgi:hypothetical protein
VKGLIVSAAPFVARSRRSTALDSHPRTPRAAIELRGSTFLREPGLLERSLFGDVLDVGVRLDPVDERVRDEQLGRFALGRSADSPSPRRQAEARKIRNLLRQLRGGHDVMFRYDCEFQA